jgi:hypothetical protein
MALAGQITGYPSSINLTCYRVNPKAYFCPDKPRREQREPELCLTAAVLPLNTFQTPSKLLLLWRPVTYT